MLKAIFQKIRPGVDVESSEDIINDYGLDSFDIMDLISTIEEKYKITIDISEIRIENFKTLSSIENFIKQQGTKND